MLFVKWEVILGFRAPFELCFQNHQNYSQVWPCRTGPTHNSTYQHKINVDECNGNWVYLQKCPTIPLKRKQRVGKVDPAGREEERPRKRIRGEKWYSAEMSKVIIFMRHKDVHSPVFACVIMWLGPQPLPTVEESTWEENRGSPFHSAHPPPPLTLSESLYKYLAVLRMAGSNFPQCVN